MKALSLVVMFLVPVLLSAEPDLQFEVDVPIKVRARAYMTSSFEPDNLFTTLDLVFPGNRFSGLVKLQAGRAKLNDLASAPGAMSALIGVMVKIGVYAQTLAGYSSDGVVLEEDIRGELNKKLFMIKRFDVELINKYTFDNCAFWSRTRSSVLIIKKGTTEFSIGGEYIYSGWNGGDDFIARGGGFAKLGMFERRLSMIIGGGKGSKSQGGYFFLEISNRLF